MLHFVASAVPGTLLFHTWAEADALWRRMVARVPLAVALVLMPDHVHLLTPHDARRAFAHALNGFAQWRNHARGEAGRVWTRSPAPVPVLGRQKEARVARYNHLNPCRARLVTDPLAWPFSTYRDAVGLAPWPVRAAAPDPVAHHAYVSGDPSVRPEGTSLPFGNLRDARGPDGLLAVRDAVSAVTRTPLGHLMRPGPARRLLVHATRTLTDATTHEIAELACVTPRTVRNAPTTPDARVHVVERVLWDPRFPALHDGDLRRLPSWRRFRNHR